MTKVEAAAVLGVDERASNPDVRRRYETLHNDFRIRLTNAPTPALKKTYQLKLQELLEACDTLYPGFTGNESSDFPSAEPTPAAVVEGPPRVATGAAPRSPARTAAPHRGGLPRSTIIASAIAVAFAGAFTFVLLRLPASRQAGAAAAGAQKQVENGDRSFYADRLRIKNVSKQAARVTSAALVYRDGAGALQVVLSEQVREDMEWSVPPGGMIQIDSDMGRGRLWDGPVLSYAFLIDYPGAQPYMQAGVWAADVDRLDKAVTFDLDVKPR